MKAQVILARAVGYNCAALIVNQVVVAEANSIPEIERLVVTAARQLSLALGVPLVECEVQVPDELDGKWVWSDLVMMLPPVQEQMAKHNFLVYCWQEGGVHQDTEHGPGDAWDELCFDTQAPMAGTPYLILAPIHETRDELDDAVRSKLLEDFKHWLNDRRMHDVSTVFHDTVAMVESYINLSPVVPSPEQLVEQVTMSLLGKQEDPAPGINWQCNREWRVNDVRQAVWRALEAGSILMRVPESSDCGGALQLEF
ncbi:hypothetical protein [Burkholderia ubonensis]|uniref:hypothetical protein n=1 Tax=Burkholderia ubonensis TaxID=101571 RepID=UPI00075566DC|nr:hypothetical protein [Burkholderia ubonensis]KVP39848.1 hypothetical protein WJ87_06605 [Burkholderia ubonensis]